jgi:phosphopantothenoylcysteine decarboxylase/phosphopantothenate--cysteine ligase
MLAEKTVVLGVTGGIAAYKAADLASKLTQGGATVNVIMTGSAMEFIAPLTFRAITHRPVVTSMFELASEFSVEHIALAEAADIVVIAPATANVIAKIAAGIADDMLTTTVLATEAPVVVAPAMNVNMWQNSVTQENVARLKERGFTFVGPGYGRLASGRMGLGRFVDVSEIMGTVQQVLGRKGDLAGKRIVVTAGGTREVIDPVRYIGNRSSGKMGFALAEAARDRGATVTLITAPVSLPVPSGMEVINVESVVEMKEAVAKATTETNALIMAAAPADYVAKSVAEQKIKKGSAALTVDLVKAPDIISEVSGDFIKVGFSAETEDLLGNARGKLERKQLDLIVANDVTAADSGFGVDTNKVTIIDREGKTEDLPLMTKREVADRVLDRVAKLIPNGGGI